VPRSWLPTDTHDPTVPNPARLMTPEYRQMTAVRKSNQA